jgi:DNA repair protein RadC
MFTLTSKNRILGFIEVSVGSMSTSVVHPRDAFRAAILQGASAVILVHNHPSGDPAPSREDFDVTKRMVNAGKILGIKVLDHIIIGDNDYYSFADVSQLDVYNSPN